MIIQELLGAEALEKGAEVGKEYVKSKAFEKYWEEIGKGQREFLTELGRSRREAIKERSRLAERALDIAERKLGRGFLEKEPRYKKQLIADIEYMIVLFNDGKSKDFIQKLYEVLTELKHYSVYLDYQAWFEDLKVEDIRDLMVEAIKDLDANAYESAFKKLYLINLMLSDILGLETKKRKRKGTKGFLGGVFI